IAMSSGDSEVLDQIAGPRVPMRLEHDMNLAKAALPRRRQRRLDLRRMVPLVVNDTNTRRPPAQLESPVNPAELVQARADRLHSNIQPHSHCNRRRSI